MSTQKIIPHLWFDDQAEEAAHFYMSLFNKHSVETDKTYYNEAGQEIHGKKAGSVMTVDFELDGYKMIALNGGPHFKFTPAISFYVTCSTENEVDELWKALSNGGTPLMPLDQYEWSKKYGWIKDKFGLSWQISLGKLDDVHGQKIIPCLMYVSKEGEAEEAITLYTSLFDNSEITGILRYGKDENQPEGSVKHSQFLLNKEEVFMAMDSSSEHAEFTFNEAISLLVQCEDQDEINHFWEKLSAAPKAEQCGWLKDKFGLSWQVVPKGMNEMLNADDPQKTKRAMNAMLQMKKLDIQKLKDAFEGN
ncbi:VOC family protein [Gracilimonas mengyeensis]|uniref:Glyoxalase superfamily enzyme, possibly 3-demethylubiquinone-9 3-methyltransferase n=1 Tax=Gracilimonas mengyeensis TaxID=1302730 RepID=A0A521FDP2_9BACT|nr:VOC family protein [Gracilimonas mengyeensis]SMO93751.1 Glyoxalase superfamily enzyme, possibly 3-demethylubiquinone-9 3-methyltransferase [Gracilimonas mengyeensis]